MYYFGTNLDDKFTVHNFWPTKEQLNKIPTEREDISAEVERMKRRRLRRREERIANEEAMDVGAGDSGDGVSLRMPAARAMGMGGPLDQYGSNVARAVEREGRGGWSG